MNPQPLHPRCSRLPLTYTPKLREYLHIVTRDYYHLIVAYRCLERCEISVCAHCSRFSVFPDPTWSASLRGVLGSQNSFDGALHNERRQRKFIKVFRTNAQFHAWFLPYDYCHFDLKPLCLKAQPFLEGISFEFLDFPRIPLYTYFRRDFCIKVSSGGRAPRRT